jgi:hypothetical protein
MKIREALEIINRMEADGIINRYAIGGLEEAWQRFERQFLGDQS